MRRWFFARTYLEVGMQISIAFVPYALGLLWALWTKRVWQVGELTQSEMDEVAVSLIETYQEEP
jgi:hypothetical protein